MSSNAEGRVIDEHGVGLPNLQVHLLDETAVLRRKIGSAKTDGGGAFAIGPYDEDPHSGSVPARGFTLSIVDSLSTRQLHTKPLTDSPGTLHLGTISMSSSDLKAFLVSGVGGAVSRLTKGNAIRFLVDNVDAWGHLSDIVGAATKSVDFMQLEFDLNPFRTIADEVPNLVTQFRADNPIGPGEERAVAPGDPKDVRPERLFLNAAKNGVPVRILLSVPAIDSRNFLAMILAQLTVVGGLLLDYILIARKLDSFGEVSRYYRKALATKVTVAAFTTSAPAVVHAKMCVVDDLEALLVSSPFIQGYFDGPTHAIDDPRRGEGVKLPIHDVSLGVRGPAVADLQQAFQLHWSVPKPGDLNPAPAVPPLAAATLPEYLAPIQVIRTLPAGKFTGDPELDANGETQILDAYSRAIGKAQQLIYLENQYFTNVAIAKALIAALKDSSRPKLQIIVLINVTPDIPFYTTWQKHRMEEIFTAISPIAGASDRIEFFAAWTHEPTALLGEPHPPRIAGNYFHTKVGIVDNLWATVGSANLDGNSLDEAQNLHALFTGIVRNTEINCAIYNGVDGQDATLAVDGLRRTLWSEHLGIPVDSAELSLGGVNAGNWLELWRTKARVKLAQLIADPNSVHPSRVLAFPHPGGKLEFYGSLPFNLFNDNEYNFLTHSGVTSAKGLQIVDKVRPFDFLTGKFTDDSMPYNLFDGP